METDIVQVTYVSVDPEPPKPGQNHTVTVRGTVLGTIEVCDTCPGIVFTGLHEVRKALISTLLLK